MDSQLLIFVFLGCLGLSFFMSGMEAGVLALSRLRIRQQMRAGRESARLLNGYLEHPERFLWTILVGNTVANFIAVSIAVRWLHHALLLQPVLLVLTFVVGVYLFYVFCDLLPKMLFRQYPNRLCLLLVRPFRWVDFLFRPLVALLARCSDVILRWTDGKAYTGRLFASRDELRQLMQESAHLLTTDEHAMINRVLDLQNLSVRQITIPLQQMVTATSDMTMRAVLDLCRERKLTRLPVWEGTGANRRIVGVVSLKTLLYHADFNPDKQVKDYVTPALYLDVNTRLEQALQRMQRSGQRMSIVLGPDRREAGVVTLEHILKVVFGEVSL
jgi:CBS domain containing-hemolysin-like protein